jgi:phosphopantothenoylcysteine decarboxylase/phosphopantothenate--cysteine ligase
LETDNELTNAYLKLQRKNMDFIVLNSMNDKGAGFGVDTNKITIIDKDNNRSFFELKSKAEVAKDIVSRLVSEFEKSS